VVREPERPPHPTWWRDADGAWRPPEDHPEYPTGSPDAASWLPPRPVVPEPGAVPMRRPARIVLGAVIAVMFGWVTWYLFQPHPGSLFVATLYGKLLLGVFPTVIGLALVVSGFIGE